MLQTCTRCRSRRIKCDSRLPACQNCAKSDVLCTFLDEALQTQIPRSYVQSLNDRISELSSQLALQESHAARASAQDAELLSTPTPRSEGCHFLMSGTQQYMYLERSTPVIISRLTVEALSSPHDTLDSVTCRENNVFSPDVSQVDRSLLTPSCIRYLVGQYENCIHPEFDIVDLKSLAQDGLGLKKLPVPEKFELLMVCAIAAARESYQNPSWKILAQICREWANEDMIAVVCPADEGSMTAILLLVVYELCEPSRGHIWELLALATRTALQLGWHRNGHSIDDVCPTDTRAGSMGDKDLKPHLLSVLRAIDGSLSFVFIRSSISRNWLSSPSTDKESVSRLFYDVQQNVYGNGKLYDTHECPFVGRMGELMMSMENYSQTQTPIICEMWLLLLPICVRHKQCVFCFQEPDDFTTRGMRSLRQQLLSAALSLLKQTHHAITSAKGFVPPIMASSRALTSGCTILLSQTKHWSPKNQHVKPLLQCTEILTYFTPHWKGGLGYLQVWNTIIELAHTS